MIIRDCMGFREIGKVPLVSIGPSGIGGEYQKELPAKIDKDCPDHLLDEILGLTKVVARILQAIQDQQERENQQGK